MCIPRGIGLGFSHGEVICTTNVQRVKGALKPLRWGRRGAHASAQG